MVSCRIYLSDLIFTRLHFSPPHPITLFQNLTFCCPNQDIPLSWDFLFLTTKFYIEAQFKFHLFLNSFCSSQSYFCNISAYVKNRKGFRLEIEQTSWSMFPQQCCLYCWNFSIVFFDIYIVVDMSFLTKRWFLQSQH